MKIFLDDLRKEFPRWEFLDTPPRGGSSLFFINVNHDSRKVVPGELFIPLVGPKFDGHDFIDEAFSRGAVASSFKLYTMPKELGL